MEYRHCTLVHMKPYRCSSRVTAALNFWLRLGWPHYTHRNRNSVLLFSIVFCCGFKMRSPFGMRARAYPFAPDRIDAQSRAFVAQNRLGAERKRDGFGSSYCVTIYPINVRRQFREIKYFSRCRIFPKKKKSADR